ncbi:methionyl-tRNA formyltransferase [Sphingobacterium tabacisoli]|uniref:Methionyl-tRNA formyltransferase n=1 Tax=Sphingobacterium tabacisoli TaxID=2044855 RepID=A0ABW5L864_9SPHI|nr:formyltransferase family protein [Sphingobacterium tabacisoli]
MRIGFLGNTEMLIPTLSYLAQTANLVAVGLWHKSAPLIGMQLRAANVPDELIQVIPDADWQSRLTDWIQGKKIEVLLVFGFPYRIPQQVLAIPRYGFYNIHPGFLPKYRGADPLFWQIANGEPEIGICIHKMTHLLDAGPIVQQTQFVANAMDNYGLVRKRVAFETVGLVKGWLEGLMNDRLTERSQEPIADIDFSKRPEELDLRIKWQEQTALEIKSLIAATNPTYGGASCYFGDMELRVLDMDIINFENSRNYKAGEIVFSDALYGPVVACADGQFIRLLVVQLADGYFSGAKLFYLGIQQGHQLN